MVLFESIYVVRNGAMGTNYETKLLITIITIFICLYDYRQNKRLDYFWVCLVGMIIWTVIEFRLQAGGGRDMVHAYLFGAKIPTLAASFLRGTMEGAFPAVLGVFFADKFLDEEVRKKYLIIAMAFLGIFFTLTLMQSKPTKDIGGDVAARREMFGIFGITLMLSILAINVLWLWKRANDHQRKRVILMFLVMFSITFVFNTGEVLANTRWVEVGSEGNYEQASPLLEFFALRYNDIVEFANMYVIFIIIPYELKLIKVEDLEESNEKLLKKIEENDKSR